MLPLGDAKLILAMGTLPPTTLVQNSFPELAPRPAPTSPRTCSTSDDGGRVGERFSAHFISSIYARVPRCSFLEGGEPIPLDNLEIGAFYVAGTATQADGSHDYGKQFHVQLTALADKNPEKNSAKVSAACLIACAALWCSVSHLMIDRPLP